MVRPTGQGRAASVVVVALLAAGTLVAPVARSAAAPAPRPRTGVAACTTGSVLSTWRLRRLAEQTVVVPVEETDVAAVTREEIGRAHV